MLATLIFGEFDKCSIPAIGPQPRSGVDWQAQIISNLGASQPLSLIHVKSRRPLSGGIFLSARRANENSRHQKRQDQQRNSSDLLGQCSMLFMVTMVASWSLTILR